MLKADNLQPADIGDDIIDVDDDLEKSCNEDKPFIGKFAVIR